MEPHGCPVAEKKRSGRAVEGGLEREFHARALSELLAVEDYAWGFEELALALARSRARSILAERVVSGRRARMERNLWRPPRKRAASAPTMSSLARSIERQQREIFTIGRYQPDFIGSPTATIQKPLMEK
jgi:hypothetical protein